jgi:hypothetical protein
MSIDDTVTYYESEGDELFIILRLYT